jgi:DNA-binding transcriptional MocR family regulator
MLLLNLDKKSTMPLYRQIFDQVKGLIEKRTLKSGDRLPASRSLAERLGVHRSTVYRAYEELWAMGYLQSRPGSYSTVRQRQQLVGKTARTSQTLVSWEGASSMSGRQLYQSFLKFQPGTHRPAVDKLINLAPLDLDSRLFPLADFRRAMNTVLLEYGTDILKYGSCEGYLPLRKYIARRMQIHGISVGPEEILISNGSQNAIELVLKMLNDPARPVLVESPTYSNVLPLFKYHNANLIGIPMTDKGMDLSYLEKVLKKQRPCFLYTIPNFHNPTGITTDQAHREALLALCEQYRLPLLEDAFEEEMKYFGKVPLPIKSMDRSQIVIYLGTFSKVLFPGIRIGWVAAEKECIQRLTSIKKFSDLTSNSLVQAALNEFCRRGYYDLHIKRMHREYRKRMQTALRSLKENLEPSQVHWREPAGGYLIWIQLKDIDMSEPEMAAILQQCGVAVAFGGHFFAEDPPQKYIRLSISTLNEAEIMEGIKRLRQGISRIYQTSKRRR